MLYTACPQRRAISKHIDARNCEESGVLVFLSLADGDDLYIMTGCYPVQRWTETLLRNWNKFVWNTWLQLSVRDMNFIYFIKMGPLSRRWNGVILMCSCIYISTAQHSLRVFVSTVMKLRVEQRKGNFFFCKRATTFFLRNIMFHGVSYLAQNFMGMPMVTTPLRIHHDWSHH
jgi:hypothetical protein